MSALFKRKKEEGNTVLLLDIENSSVGSALVRLSPHEAPRLFGETRIHIPLLKTHVSENLPKEIERAVQEALNRVMEVAARVRLHSESLGTIGHTAVFMSPPWATLAHVSSAVPHPITQRIYNSLVTLHGPAASTSFHSFATAASHIVPSIFPHEERYLLYLVSGEVIEFVALEQAEDQGRILGHATLPFGHNALFRTLSSHSGLSRDEALSLLKLGHTTHSLPTHEPLAALAADMSRGFESVTQDLAAIGALKSIFVIAHEPMGEWFARSLAEYATTDDLFPQGGTIRALKGTHLSPFVAVHAHRPDMAFLLESLFIDARMPGGRFV